jgi:hypothetical protein
VKTCPYCGYANYDQATSCRKCDGPFVVADSDGENARRQHINPHKARWVRNHALALVAIGLLMKVYWGGYGPWPVIDLPILASIRVYAEPILILGGLAFYLLGWIAILI